MYFYLSELRCHDWDTSYYYFLSETIHYTTSDVYEIVPMMASRHNLYINLFCLLSNIFDNAFNTGSQLSFLILSSCSLWKISRSISSIEASLLFT